MSFAFLFPGQGSQFPGMGAEYIRNFPFIKNYFIEANDILNYDIFSLAQNGPEEELNLTANAQPAILILGYCSYQVIKKETGIKPFLMSGHSLGEITALCCSGAINFQDAVKIVRRRGELMQLAVSDNGSMIAVNGLPASEVQKLCETGEYIGEVAVSNINSASQVVISGVKKGVEEVAEQARLLGAVTIPLKVSAPFHSPLMKPAAIGLEAELNKYTYSEPEYPVLSNVTCKPYMDKNDIIPLLTEQVTTPVNWLKTMEYIRKTRVNKTIEMLPKKTLTKFFKGQKYPIINYTFDQFEEIRNLTNV